MFLFLLIVQTLVAIALITVVLMQRSEGGGLAGGGSPSGLMTARGAADFLTRATTILGTAFVVLSILLAAIAAQTAGPRTIDVNALGSQAPAPGGQPQPATPAAPGAVPGIPTLTPQAPAGNGQAAIPTLTAPAQPAGNTQGGVPLAQ